MIEKESYTVTITMVRIARSAYYLFVLNVGNESNTCLMVSVTPDKDYRNHLIFYFWYVNCSSQR